MKINIQIFSMFKEISAFYILGIEVCVESEKFTWPDARTKLLISLYLYTDSQSKESKYQFL